MNDSTRAPARIVRLALAAACLAALSTASAEDYWQIQSGHITVVAVGRKAAPAEAATVLVRLQNAARWMVGSSADLEAPSVLALALTSHTINRYFEHPKHGRNDVLGGPADQGIVISAPRIVVVIFSISPIRGKEFDELQYLYGRELLDRGPSARWPECIRMGMGTVLAAAELNVPHQLFLRVDKPRFPLVSAAGALREFIAPDNAPASQYTRDSRAYSCYLLSAMALRDQPLPRAGLLEYFRLVGANTDLEQAARSALGIGDEELSKTIKEFDRKMRFQPDAYRMRIDIPGDEPSWPAAEPISPERMNNMLTSLAARVNPSTAH